MTQRADIPIGSRPGRRALAALLVGVGFLIVGFSGFGASSGAPSFRSLLPDGVPAFSLQGPPPEAAPTGPRHLFRIPVTVTGYSSTADQTDDTPFTTAANTRVRSGVIALSRDLLREFTPGAPFAFGDLLEIEGVGVFRVEDTMALRFRHRADIWFSTRTAAQRWGCQRLQLAKLTREARHREETLQRRSLPLFEAAVAD